MFGRAGAGRVFAVLMLGAGTWLALRALRPAAGPVYEVVDLGTPGGHRSVGVAVNDAGEVAGSSALPGDRTYHVILYRRGRVTDLGLAGMPAAISGEGRIVGITPAAG